MCHNTVTRIAIEYVQRVRGNLVLVCWFGRRSSVLTPAIGALTIRARGTVGVPLRLGRSLALGW